MTDVVFEAAEPAPPKGDLLLEVEGLTVEFDTEDGVVSAVSDLSYTLSAGETLAILGESGSGKSVSVQALMGLVPSPPGRIVGGTALFHGVDLLSANRSTLSELRGAEIAMIFQDPLTSLNPVFTVGWQIGEVFRRHRGASRREARQSAVELMNRVGIPNASARARQFPHEFSGGMRQRAMIAMALALDPKILIADEPTTALDVTVQAQIMELIGEVQAEHNMGLILITHDLGVVASVADRVLMMYAGRAVEKASAQVFYRSPQHPYSRGLLASVPRLIAEKGRLEPIVGTPPSLVNLPEGCSFNPRCPYVIDRCLTERPELVELPDHQSSAACFRVGEI